MFWRDRYKQGYEDGKRAQMLYDQMRISELEKSNERLRSLLIRAQDRCDRLLDKLEKE